MDIEKAKMMSLDMTQENVKKIQGLFPNAVTEVIGENGKVKLAIDFDVLKQELSDALIDERQERYQTIWPGKKQSILNANKATMNALRPMWNDSVNFDTTKNIYIRGDNLETLKLLRETYLGKIKMIYIDPPYNTGSDFLYDDNFAMSSDQFLEQDSQHLNGFRMVENVSSYGKFHTNWLNMIYPRIKIARDLLSEDGVLFISIDDHELPNLLKVCSEIFSSHVDVMVWRKSGVGRDGKMKNTATFRKDHEYIVVCYKDKETLNKTLAKPEFVNKVDNADNDPRGPWLSGSISRSDEDSNTNSPNYYEVVSPAGTIYKRQFEVSKEEFDALNEDGRISWGKSGTSVPRIKIFTNEVRAVTTSSYVFKPINEMNSDTIDNKNATTTSGSKELDDILGFSGIGGEMRPKPSFLIKMLVQIGTAKDSIILDFFSGTSTTAQAVMEQNNEDGGTRSFICVQIPQENGEDSIAWKNGYRSICDIGEERIRRVGNKLKGESGLLSSNLDIGFRVFKLDSSNMNEVYYNPKAMTQNLLEATVDNVKPDRGPLDLLFQVMLECGALLSSKIEEKTINGKKIFVVEENYIAACFDDKLDNKTIEEIAKLHPVYACFKGSSFDSDPANINAEQIFKTYSPNTEKVKVI